jgi:putative inorganic carbon (hco3(-)) transporter
MPHELRYARLAWPLAGLALLVCLAALGVHDASPTRAVELGAGLATLAAVAYVAWHVEPAYIFCGAIAASCFSGDWSLLGFPNSVAPDRLLLLGAIAMVVVRSRGAHPRPRFRMRLSHLLLLLVSLYVVTSAVWAGTLSNREALFRMTDRFGLVPFLAFAVAPLAFRTQRHRQALVATLVGVGAYLSLTALFETTGTTALVLPHFISDPSLGLHFGRARGPFLEAQTMGMALFACAIACCVGFTYWRSREARALLAAVALLCMAGTLFTLQRAVWVGVIAACAAALLSVRRLRRYVVPAALGGCVLVVLLLAVVPGLSEKVSSRTGEQADRSLWDRQNLNAAALRAVDANPLFGVGWERWQDVGEPYLRTSPDYPVTGSVNGQIQVVHNVVLSNAAELGLLGTSLWLLALVAVFASALMRRGPPDHAAWRAGLVALGVMWVVVMLFTPLAKPFPTLLVFLWAGVTFGAGWPSAVAGDQQAAVVRVARRT